MSKARLENLVRAMGHIRTKVTKHCNLVTKELSDLTEHKRRTYLDKLESLKQVVILLFRIYKSNLYILNLRCV